VMSRPVRFSFLVFSLLSLFSSSFTDGTSYLRIGTDASSRRMDLLLCQHVSLRRKRFKLLCDSGAFSSPLSISILPKLTLHTLPSPHLHPPSSNTSLAREPRPPSRSKSSSHPRRRVGGRFMGGIQGRRCVVGSSWRTWS